MENGHSLGRNHCKLSINCVNYSLVEWKWIFFVVVSTKMTVVVDDTSFMASALEGNWSHMLRKLNLIDVNRSVSGIEIYKFFNLKICLL